MENRMKPSFCIKYGNRLNGEKFCPACGAKVSEDERPRPNIPKRENIFTDPGKANTIDANKLYIAMMIAPLAFLIPLICKWFKISYGDESMKFGLYGFVETILEIGDNAESAGAVAAGIIVGIIMAILAAAIIYNAVKAIYRAYNKNSACARNIGYMSILAIIMGAIAVICVFIIRAIISHYAKSFYLGSMVGDLVNFTLTPILMIVFGIVGKLFSNKFRYSL